MDTRTAIDRNKTIAQAFYECAKRGDMTAFFALAAEDFTITAPAYLPWGGVHRGKDEISKILPIVAAHVDFQRYSLESLTAEEDRVVVALWLGVNGSSARLRFSDHWEIEDGLASSMWFAVFEPEALNLSRTK
jgi:ketosteroid isomerase-like protein